MLKQDTKTINAEFIWTCALSQLSFVQFKSYEPCSRWASSLFGINAKIKKTMETSLNLTALFKTSIDARAQGLVLNVDYLEKRQNNFIKKKKKKWQKKTSAVHTHFVLWIVIFLFLLTFYAVDDSLKLDSHLPAWLTIKYNTHIAQYLMN